MACLIATLKGHQDPQGNRSKCNVGPKSPFVGLIMTIVGRESDSLFLGYDTPVHIVDVAEPSRRNRVTNDSWRAPSLAGLLGLISGGGGLRASSAIKTDWTVSAVFQSSQNAFRTSSRGSLTVSAFYRLLKMGIWSEFGSSFKPHNVEIIAVIAPLESPKEGEAEVFQPCHHIRV